MKNRPKTAEILPPIFSERIEFGYNAVWRTSAPCKQSLFELLVPLVQSFENDSKTNLEFVEFWVLRPVETVWVVEEDIDRHLIPCYYARQLQNYRVARLVLAFYNAAGQGQTPFVNQEGRRAGLCSPPSPGDEFARLPSSAR